MLNSCYHFFPSKEALFEAVVKNYLMEYTQRISDILGDGSLNAEQIFEGILDALRQTSEMYYNVLQGNRLHWTVQCVLHDMTLEAMVEPLKRSLTRLQANGTVRSNLHVDDNTLARILLKGSEAVIHGAEETDAASFLSEKMCSNLLEFWKIIITY